MNASIVFLLVAVALVAAQDVKTEFAKYTEECAIKYNIPTEQLTVMRSTKDKTTIQPSEDLKNYVKCVIGKSGVVAIDSTTNFERIVEIGSLQGFEETTFRTKVESCKPFYTTSHTADDAWAFYSCVFSK